MEAAKLPRPELANVLPLIRSSLGRPSDPGQPSLGIIGLAAPLVKPYLEDMFILYVADQGNFYQYLNQGDLKTFGLTLEALDSIAWANFVKKAGSLPLRISPTNTGLSYLITIGEELEASLLMSSRLWEDLAKQLQGRLVATCPARDVLVFCDANNPAAIAELNSRAAEVWKSADKPLSKTLLEWMGDGWLRYP